MRRLGTVRRIGARRKTRKVAGTRARSKEQQQEDHSTSSFRRRYLINHVALLSDHELRRWIKGYLNGQEIGTSSRDGMMGRTGVLQGG